MKIAISAVIGIFALVGIYIFVGHRQQLTDPLTPLRSHVIHERGGLFKFGYPGATLETIDVMHIEDLNPDTAAAVLHDRLTQFGYNESKFDTERDFDDSSGDNIQIFPAKKYGGRGVIVVSYHQTSWLDRTLAKIGHVLTEQDLGNSPLKFLGEKPQLAGVGP